MWQRICSIDATNKRMWMRKNQHHNFEENSVEKYEKEAHKGQLARVKLININLY